MEGDDDFTPPPPGTRPPLTGSRPPLAHWQAGEVPQRAAPAPPSRPQKQTQLSLDARLRRPPPPPAPPDTATTTATPTSTHHHDGCPICLDPWHGAGPHRVVALKSCGHLFGHSCAKSAVRSTRRCPLCSATSKPSDILVLFNVSGLAGAGRSNEQPEDGDEDLAVVEAAARRAAEAALATTRVELAAAKAEIRRLTRRNARLVALWGRDVPEEEEEEGGGGGGGGENEGLPGAAAQCALQPPPLAAAAPHLLALAACPPAPGATTVALCATVGYAVVGCGSGGGGGAAASLRIHSLLSPASPPAVVAVRAPGFAPGCVPSVWAIALNTRDVRGGANDGVGEGAGSGPSPAATPRAAVLLGWPALTSSGPGVATHPHAVAIAVVDLRSGSTVAAWPVSGGGFTTLAWDGPTALVLGGARPGASPTAFDLVRPPPLGVGHAASPAKAAAVEQAADDARFTLPSILATLPPLPPGTAVLAADKDGDSAAVLLVRKPAGLFVSLYVRGPGGGGGGGCGQTAKRARW